MNILNSAQNYINYILHVMVNHTMGVEFNCEDPYRKSKQINMKAIAFYRLATNFMLLEVDPTI